ncbi:NERD domain-containing protein [Evansella tamaricis]|uniref:NERD domain-containing protein n=1 Tax=Evansella tamaricis TaxID=2069301 RepID=A0ABS6JKK9_9BACI|nr:NERD domain-containing protein [Evansella tamaricis]MBU9713739.1 NERD domain-containing protein [Evansella tamaricis]
MAQLVKLSDYVSRYETDIYRYPSRFVRLKKERWQRILTEWERQEVTSNHNHEKETVKKGKGIWPFKRKVDKEEVTFHPFIKSSTTKTLEEVKEGFQKELHSFKVNWASSTVSEISSVQRKHYYDNLLITLLRDLPDSNLLFYYPAILHKKAPVDLDILLLTPSELWLITPLGGNDKTIYRPQADRFWEKVQGHNQEKILNPVISLKRMRTVMETILLEKNLSVTIKTLILAKDSYIDVSHKRITTIDKRTFTEWKQSLVKNVAPIKHQQLKIAEAILSQTITISRKRQEFVDGTIND